MSLSILICKMICIGSVVLKLECATESTGGLMKMQITGLHPQIPQSWGVGV